MNTNELRQRAAVIIERHGWTHHFYGNEYEGFCIYGALIEASAPLHRFITNAQIRMAAQDIALELGLEMTLLPNPLVAWNDSPERTKQEVINALRGRQGVAELATDRELVAV